MYVIYLTYATNRNNCPTNSYDFTVTLKYHGKSKTISYYRFAHSMKLVK